MFNRKLASLALVSAASSMLIARTSKDLYETTQENRLQECQKRYGAQREECEAQYQKSYDTYERERNEVINEGK